VVVRVCSCWTPTPATVGALVAWMSRDPDMRSPLGASPLGGQLGAQLFRGVWDWPVCNLLPPTNAPRGSYAKCGSSGAGYACNDPNKWWAGLAKLAFLLWGFVCVCVRSWLR
jgi:hypothetical protein